jgi:hypothetical protein
MKTLLACLLVGGVVAFAAPFTNGSMVGLALVAFVTGLVVSKLLEDRNA